MQKRIILGAVAVAVLGLVAAYAKEATQKSSEEEVIRRAAGEYAAAYNDGKVDAVLDYWSDDADYVDEDGQASHGKDAIRALFKQSLENLKGSKLDLKIDSVHLLKPDVAVEDGVASLTGPDGDKSQGHYTAVWTKDHDHWRISNAHDLPMKEESAPETNADYLKPLDWLIGDWKSDDKGRTVNLTSKWALDKNYIVQNYVVSGEAGDDLKVTQWIGFDPISGQIKSRAFDSRGGYGEGLWERDDNTWSSEATGVLPDGRTGSAQNSVRFVDDTHMEWRSTGRNIDGQPMADVEVKFVRAGKESQDSKR
jgi:uncharacterized protein (TIGR02246 family)